MAALSPSGSGAISRTSWHAVFAGFLGWTLDAFDFFVVIFMYDTLAAHFHRAAALRTYFSADSAFKTLSVISMRGLR